MLSYDVSRSPREFDATASGCAEKSRKVVSADEQLAPGKPVLESKSGHRLVQEK